MVQTALLEVISTRLYADRLEDTLPFLRTAALAADTLGLSVVADDLHRAWAEVRDITGQLRSEAQYSAPSPQEHTDRLAAIVPLLESAAWRTSQEWIPFQLPDMIDYARGEVRRVVVLLRSDS